LLLLVKEEGCRIQEDGGKGLAQAVEFVVSNDDPRLLLALDHEDPHQLFIEEH